MLLRLSLLLLRRPLLLLMLLLLLLLCLQVYISGHGGNEFMKFQDTEELMAQVCVCVGGGNGGSCSADRAGNCIPHHGQWAVGWVFGVAGFVNMVNHPAFARLLDWAGGVGRVVGGGVGDVGGVGGGGEAGGRACGLGVREVGDLGGGGGDAVS